MDLVAKVRQVLNQCLEALPKSTCAFLATCDGHLVEARGQAPENMDVLLAMAGSMLGLGRSVVASLPGEQRLDDVIVRSNEHVVTMIRVEDAEDLLFIGVIAGRMVNLGQMLVLGKQCAARVLEFSRH